MAQLSSLQHRIHGGDVTQESPLLEAERSRSDSAPAAETRLHTRARERRGIAAGLAWIAAVAVADVATGRSVTLISFLLVGPLLTSLRASVRGTGLVAACAVLVAVPLGVADSNFLTSDHLIRIGVVAAGSAVAVIVARKRIGLELARVRYALIADAGVVVSSALDWEVGLIELARLCAQRIADWCFVFIVQEDGSIRQLAAAHEDLERQRLAWELLFRYPLDPDRPEGPAKVIRSGEPDLQSRVSDSLLEVIAADEENLRLLRALGLRSAMIVPLSARGRTIGAIAFASAESRIRYGREDLVVAQDLASRAAIAVDNSRLYEGLQRTQSELRTSRDQLRAILDGVADAVTAQDRSGRVVYANDAAARQVGLRTAAELIALDPREMARRYRMFAPDGRPLPFERLPGRRALAGEDPEPTLVRYQLADGSAEGWSLVKATAITDEEGVPVLAINVVEDVTEQREREQQQRFLADSGMLLAGSLDVGETFPEVAQLVVRELADWCTIEVLEDDGATRLVGAAHSDAELLPVLRAAVGAVAQARDARPAVSAALAGGRAVLRGLVDDAVVVASARGPEHLEMLRRLSPRALIAAPMLARGEVVGVVTFAVGASGRILDESHRLLAEELAARLALALDNARLYRERSGIARTLQESLLPPLLPDMPGLDVAARFRAAGQGIEVGGDFYDLFELGGEDWAVAIGDVCGKGSEAAAITALARYTVRAAAMREAGPSQILELVNEVLLRQRTERRFCTVLYGRLNANGDGVHFAFSSGGHPLPLVLRADGADGGEAGEPGTLLGIVADPNLGDDAVTLRPGDAVVLYTDGVTDAAAPDRIHTPEELLDMIGSPARVDADAIAERVMRAALDGASGEPRDDIAIVVLKVPDALNLPALGAQG